MCTNVEITTANIAGFATDAASAKSRSKPPLVATPLLLPAFMAGLETWHRPRPTLAVDSSFVVLRGSQERPAFATRISDVPIVLVNSIERRGEASRIRHTAGQ